MISGQAKFSVVLTEEVLAVSVIRDLANPVLTASSVQTLNLVAFAAVDWGRNFEYVPSKYIMRYLHLQKLDQLTYFHAGPKLTPSSADAFRIGIAIVTDCERKTESEVFIIPCAAEDLLPSLILT